MRGSLDKSAYDVAMQRLCGYLDQAVDKIHPIDFRKNMCIEEIAQ
jgi:hypothetical protein